MTTKRMEETHEDENKEKREEEVKKWADKSVAFNAKFDELKQSAASYGSIARTRYICSICHLDDAGAMHICVLIDPIHRQQAPLNPFPFLKSQHTEQLSEPSTP